MRGVADGQRQPCAAGQCRRSGSRAEHDAPVLGRHAARAHLGRAARRRAHREDLVEHERIVQRARQRLDRGPDAQHAAVLVEHREALVGPERREPLGELGRVDRARPHAAGLMDHAQPPLGLGPERHDAVARQQLAGELLLPVAPSTTRLARERHQPAIGVRMAEDPRLSAGLGLAGPAALVHRHRRPALDQRVRGRQAGDPGADDRDVGPADHPARSAGGRSSGSGSSWGETPCSSSHVAKASPSRPTCSPAPPRASRTRRPGPRLTSWRRTGRARHGRARRARASAPRPRSAG